MLYFTAVSSTVISPGVIFKLKTNHRDADPPEFTLSFDVRVTPPTYVTCEVDNTPVDVTDLSRQVTSGEYNPPSTDSPVISVTVTMRTRQAGNYQCIVSVFRASGSNLTDVSTSPISVSGKITVYCNQKILEE